MIELTIKRSKWLRRKNASTMVFDSRLLDSNGNMCCMGFDARYVCMTPNHIIEDRTYPEQVGLKHLDFVPKIIDTRNIYRLSRILSNVNDRTFGNASDFYWVNTISDEEQEQVIARLYSLVGYKITFED